MSAKPLRVGSWVVDTESGNTGRILFVAGREVDLVSADARTEWTAEASKIRAATVTEELLAKVGAYNQLNRER